MKILLKCIVFFGCMYLMVSCVMSHSITCLKYASVVEIGGCSKSSCGVKLSNGYKRDMYNPILGEQICTSTESHFEFKLIRGL